MLETLIASLFTLDITLLLLIINRKVYQPNMTQTQEEDLYDYQQHQKGWEFKILRTGNDGFRHRKLLKLVCEQELESGWILLEKIDDSRLRFRRPVMFRERDHLAKLDPYRSHYGNQATNYISIAIVVLIMAIPTFVGYTFMQNVFKSVRIQNLQSSPKTKTVAPPPAPVLSAPKPIAKP